MRCPLIVAALFLAMPLAAVEPAELLGNPDGRLHLLVDGAELTGFSPVAADGTWKFAFPTAVAVPAEAPTRYELKLGAAVIAGELRTVEHDGRVEATWTSTAATGAAFNTLAVASGLGLAQWSGGTWKTDTKQGTFPQAFAGAQIFAGDATSLAVTSPEGRTFTLAFAQPASLLLQDDRQWGGQGYTIRAGRTAGRLAAGESATLAMTVSVPEGLRFRRDLPVELHADADWVPLQTELEIEPGSALDFSALGLTDGPCGSHGRVVATPDGHFAYADQPGTPRRFYGVNLCFSANYLDKGKADRLLDRLVRLGYNAVRIHHYEYRLTRGDWKAGFDWDPARVDQLDYLMAGCAKRGLWLTTDLYVSRPVPGTQLGGTGDAPAQGTFKLLVPVSEPAFQDWMTFSRKLLDRVNPYTGKRVAEEPALAWISLINEGPVSHGWGEARKMPEWKAAWNRWLAKAHADRTALATALGDLAAAEDPAAGTVVLPENLRADDLRARLCQVFVADTERAMVDRMRRFLRAELKCPALLTDLNNQGSSPVPMQAPRREFDYIDEHFYVDHPIFLDKQWNLPSSSGNGNPVRSGATGGASSATARIWGRPFTISEFDYSGPGRFRGVGGMLTGALAAFQDWDAVWRFAYAHKEEALFTPAPIDYFNLVNDPLNQAADRAAVLLYLRRDLAAAPAKIAAVLPTAELRAPRPKLSLAGMESAMWLAGVGCAVVDDATQVSHGVLTVAAESAGGKEAVLGALRTGSVPVPGSDGVIHSGGGQITLDPRHGVLAIDTPRTAGGYADPGQTVAAPQAGLRIDGFTVGASLTVSSLSAAPIRSAPRLLVTHLTDLQNTGARYAESARQTLVAWGGLPHLVRDGAATVHLAVDAPADCRVWALSLSGHRLEQVPTTVEANELVFTVRVRAADGARMLYEVSR